MSPERKPEKTQPVEIPSTLTVCRMISGIIDAPRKTIEKLQDISTSDIFESGVILDESLVEKIDQIIDSMVFSTGEFIELRDGKNKRSQELNREEKFKLELTEKKLSVHSDAIRALAIFTEWNRSNDSQMKVLHHQRPIEIDTQGNLPEICVNLALNYLKEYIKLGNDASHNGQYEGFVRGTKRA